MEPSPQRTRREIQTEGRRLSDAPNEADHWARAWLMTLLDGAARAGLTPLSQATIHHLAFLANVLAPIYGLPVETGLVTRWKRGPYSPELQWDLDRLSIMGLADIISVGPVSDRGKWFVARYGLGPLAPTFLERSLAVGSLARVHRFHCELLTAFASLAPTLRGAVVDQDATYANTVDGDLGESETVIDFAEWKNRNYTQRASATLETHLGGIRVDPRRRVHVYLRYLARRTAKARAS